MCQHDIRVIDGGRCADCNRERQAKHRETNKVARQFCTILTEREIPLDVDRITEGHRLLTALDLARNPRIA